LGEAGVSFFSKKGFSEEEIEAGCSGIEALDAFCS